MLIKFFIITFVFFAISRALVRYRKQEISSREAILWSLFWVGVLAATLWPKTTDIIAQAFGVGRGADMLIFISIVVLFFLAFKIIVKLEKIERDITKIVRKVALDEKQMEKSNKNSPQSSNFN